MRDREPAVTLALAGKGPELERVQRHAGRLGLGDSVRYLGFVPDAELPAAYASADAFASASQFETQGMTAVEAMACGTPVAAVRARGLADYVLDGKTGYLWKPDDVESAADAILRTLHAGEGIRSEARRHAETLGVARFASQLEDLYAGLLDRRKAQAVS